MDTCWKMSPPRSHYALCTCTCILVVGGTKERTGLLRVRVIENSRNHFENSEVAFAQPTLRREVAVLRAAPRTLRRRISLTMPPLVAILLLAIHVASVVSAPPGPWALLNASRLASLSLADMAYQTDSSASTTLIVRGRFDSGPFSTLDATNSPRTVAHLFVETALFLPSTSNTTGAWAPGSKGMVLSVNMDGSSVDSPSSTMLADLAVELGVPLIAAWYNTSVPRAFGYQGMNSLNAVTMQAMPHRHPCNITSDQGERLHV